MLGMREKQQTRSPVGTPLPQAGESGERQFAEQLDEIAVSLGMALLLILFALIEWLRYWKNIPPSPKFVSIVCGTGLVYCVWRIQKQIPKLRQLRRGINGEKAVAEVLDGLRSKGYRVFHDVSGNGDWNIDHVLIGPAGIFSIETKTRSKPLRGKTSVRFDGKTILINGKEADRDPVAQAKAGAKEIKEVLKEMTGKDVWVQPVVLFPGWWVDEAGEKNGVYVSNETFFALSFEPRREHDIKRLQRQDVDVLAAGLARWLRTRATN